MSQRQFLIILGVWIIVFLFLGFPSSWNKVFALVTGVVVAGIAIRLAPKVPSSDASSMSYTDHKAEPVSSASTADSADIAEPRQPSDQTTTTTSQTEQ